MSERQEGTAMVNCCMEIEDITALQTFIRPNILPDLMTRRIALFCLSTEAKNGMVPTHSRFANFAF